MAMPMWIKRLMKQWGATSLVLMQTRWRCSSGKLRHIFDEQVVRWQVVDSCDLVFSVQADETIVRAGIDRTLNRSMECFFSQVVIFAKEDMRWKQETKGTFDETIRFSLWFSKRRRSEGDDKTKHRSYSTNLYPELRLWKFVCQIGHS